MGRKLIGSAQVRRKGVVMQHGALPLRGDVARLVEVLALDEVDRRRLRAALRARAVTLEEALGRDVRVEDVSHALAKGFGEELNMVLEGGDLSRYELATATRLQERYTGQEWTFSR
jgi:lipoate-protein ligase A